MTNLSKLKQIKISETEFPANSEDVVTNITAKLRKVQIRELADSTEVYLNLEATDGRQFVDVTRFKGDENRLASTVKYFSAHTKNIFNQLGDKYDKYLNSIEDVLELLNKAEKEKAQFLMSTVDSGYKDPKDPSKVFLDVLYGDEKQRGKA